MLSPQVFKFAQRDCIAAHARVPSQSDGGASGLAMQDLSCLFITLLCLFEPCLKGQECATLINLETFPRRSCTARRARRLRLWVVARAKSCGAHFPRLAEMA